MAPIFIIGIFSVTGIAAAMNLVSFNGLVAAPPSLGPTLMQLDIVGAFDVAMISVIIAFLFVNLFVIIVSDRDNLKKYLEKNVLNKFFK